MAKNSPAGNEWLHLTDCQLFSIGETYVISGRWKTCFHNVSILSGNEKSNTEQSDRSIESNDMGFFAKPVPFFPGHS